MSVSFSVVLIVLAATVAARMLVTTTPVSRPTERVVALTLAMMTPSAVLVMLLPVMHGRSTA